MFTMTPKELIEKAWNGDVLALKRLREIIQHGEEVSKTVDIAPRARKLMKHHADGGKTSNVKLPWWYSWIPWLSGIGGFFLSFMIIWPILAGPFTGPTSFLCALLAWITCIGYGIWWRNTKLPRKESNDPLAR